MNAERKRNFARLFAKHGNTPEVEVPHQAAAGHRTALCESDDGKVYDLQHFLRLRVFVWEVASHIHLGYGPDAEDVDDEEDGRPLEATERRALPGVRLLGFGSGLWRFDGFLAHRGRLGAARLNEKWN